MAVWVYFGDDFDAADELCTLRDTYTGDVDKSAGIVNGFYELLRITRRGFLPHVAWFHAGDVFLFQDAKFRMVVTVPGDGRRQTRDVVLAASETFDFRIWSRRGRNALLDAARERVRLGKARKWSL